MLSHKNIAENLLNSGAVKVSVNPPFTWTSGIRSPIYCDNRLMISFPEERRQVVKAFVELIHEKSIDVDVIGGTATAAIPWAAFLAYELDKPMIYVRPRKKEHGAGKQIEGYLEPGSRVLIVEDLVSTGGSSIEAVNVVRSEGRAMAGIVLAIVTYELEEAVNSFQEAGATLYALTGFSQIIQIATERGDLPLKMIEVVQSFKDDPAGWWDSVV